MFTYSFFPVSLSSHLLKWRLSLCFPVYYAALCLVNSYFWKTNRTPFKTHCSPFFFLLVLSKLLTYSQTSLRFSFRFLFFFFFGLFFFIGHDRKMLFFSVHFVFFFFFFLPLFYFFFFFSSFFFFRGPQKSILRPQQKGLLFFFSAFIRMFISSATKQQQQKKGLFFVLKPFLLLGLATRLTVHLFFFLSQQ